jgi:hypothetical protein
LIAGPVEASDGAIAGGLTGRCYHIADERDLTTTARRRESPQHPAHLRARLAAVTSLLEDRTDAFERLRTERERLRVQREVICAERDAADKLRRLALLIVSDRPGGVSRDNFAAL